jgi:hypothetical protein
MDWKVNQKLKNAVIAKRLKMDPVYLSKTVATWRTKLAVAA